MGVGKHLRHSQWLLFSHHLLVSKVFGTQKVWDFDVLAFDGLILFGNERLLGQEESSRITLHHNFVTTADCLELLPELHFLRLLFFHSFYKLLLLFDCLTLLTSQNSFITEEIIFFVCQKVVFGVRGHNLSKRTTYFDGGKTCL